MIDSLTPTKTFLEHLTEIRSRLFWCATSIIGASVIGYILNNTLLSLLISPLKQTVYYTSPTGGFEVVFNVSLLFGVIVAFPVIVYHILQFVIPAMPQTSRRAIVGFIVASWVLMILGLIFAYFLSLPTALNFLKGFGTDQLKSLISTDQYFSFVAHYLAGFAILFQLPLIMLVINRITPLRSKTLLSLSRFVILISFVLGAILTPTPDPVNQIIMAFPIIFLYGITGIIITTLNKYRYGSLLSRRTSF